jgi:hypothetical protein
MLGTFFSQGFLLLLFPHLSFTVSHFYRYHKLLKFPSPAPHESFWQPFLGPHGSHLGYFPGLLRAFFGATFWAQLRPSLVPPFRLSFHLPGLHLGPHLGAPLGIFHASWASFGVPSGAPHGALAGPLEVIFGAPIL